ncbi:MAG TPA: serine/threonine-protein kinase [Acidimicrobiales bacterium]|nr:serine/threonine-protein kinase [Acidimicrobiales bacterium]
MRSTTPTVIAGRYEVGELLGRGGMAEVYAGIDRRLSRPVAIKLLQESMAVREDVRVRFEAEARAAAAITQPHAVAVYDSGEHEGIPYIVMERLPGDTLADRIATGPVLSAAEARGFGRQVLGALEAAHGVGMVHRDVKPGNILLTREGSAKIADFGIAKSLDVSADLTGTGQVIGTPAYLAPEQLAGDGASPVSDLYSLGVVLYEALTGRKPYEGDNALASARAIVAGDHEPLAHVRPDLDPGLVRAVERAMDSNPQARFSTAAAMSAALAPPAVPTMVPPPAGAMAAVGPDGTQVLDTEAVADADPDATNVDPNGSRGTGAAGMGAAGAAASRDRAYNPGLSSAAPPPAPPLAGRRQPSREVRYGLGALAVLAILLLLFQMFRPGDGDGDGTVTATETAATSSTTPPTTSAPSPAALLAAELRNVAAGLDPGDGAAAPGLGAKLRAVADQVERGDAAATTTAAALIIEVALARQAGQLGDAATLSVIQLLQKVQGFAAPAAAPPPTPNPATTIVVVDPVRGRGERDKDNEKDDD